MDQFIIDPLLLSSATTITDGQQEQESHSFFLQAVPTTQIAWPSYSTFRQHPSLDASTNTATATTTVALPTATLTYDQQPTPLALPPALPALREYPKRKLMDMLLPISPPTPTQSPSSVAMPLSAPPSSDVCDRKLGSVRELVKDVKNYEDVLDWASDYADSCKVRERERLKNLKCYERLSPEQKRKESSRIEARVHKVKREKLEKAHVLAIKYLVDLLHVKRNQKAARKIKKVVNAVLLLQRWRVPPMAAARVV